jgi:predicted O-methyltransferase YrrM
VANTSLNLSEELREYLLAVSLRESAVLRRLREHTAAEQMARMQIAPEQGQLMALLARLMGARRALEVGVYTGYSALCVASALPVDGKLVACDISEAWTRIAQRFWNEAGVAERIELRLGPALGTLDALLHEGQAERFDFAFIDADKVNYAHYYERALQLVRPGGLIAVDNTLWSGSVIDPTDQEPDTLAIRAFNESIHADHRVQLSLVPIGDGLTLALKL